jgi:hypothetical protein
MFVSPTFLSFVRNVGCFNTKKRKSLSTVFFLCVTHAKKRMRDGFMTCACAQKNAGNFALQPPVPPAGMPPMPPGGSLPPMQGSMGAMPMSELLNDGWVPVTPPQIIGEGGVSIFTRYAACLLSTCRGSVDLTHMSPLTNISGTR